MRTETATERDIGPFSSQIGPLFFLTGIFFINFISRIIFAPLMPMIEKDLSISHGEAGSFFLVISFGYFLTLICSGFFSKYLRHRGAIILSSVLLGAALVAASFSSDLNSIRFGLLILGMAAGIYLPSGIATLTSLIHSKDWGKAIAVHEMAPNLSFVVAPLLCEAMLVFFSWRGILDLLGVASIIVGLAFGILGRGGDARGESPSFGSFRVLFSERSFWIMVLLFSLGISGSLGIYTMLPLYLVTDRGIDRNWANTIIAISRVSGLGIAFLSGWISDRIGPAKTMAGVFFITGIFTVLLGLIPGSSVLVLVFLQPLTAVCFFPPAFSALSLIGPEATRNVAVSLTIPLGFLIGAGAVPIGIGVAGDAGSFPAGIAILGCLIFSGAFLTRRLVLRERD